MIVMSKVKVIQRKSAIGTLPSQRKTLRALGLRKINAERIHEKNPVIEGMINKVHHLVEVQDVK
jgi:large subunit ribosomal protein L30